MSAYNVYAAFDKDGEYLYIGSGLPDRYKHVTSGHSHVYDLNKLHFSGYHPDVKILKEFKSKADSLVYEKEMIALKSPKFNKTFNTGGNKTIPSSEVPNLIADFLKSKDVTIKQASYCRKLLRSLFQFVKPNLFFREVPLPYLRDTSEDCLTYEKVRRALREKDRLIAGKNRNALSMVLASDSPTSCVFTEEFKEFCYNK